MKGSDFMEKLLKYIFGLSIFAVSTFVSVGGVEAAPVRCQDAVRRNVMQFDKNEPWYLYSNMRDALLYCRIEDWISEMRRYVSPYRTISDYDYYREPATALRNDNLTVLRKWMCREMKKKRANGEYSFQYRYPGCGEKP